VTRCVVCFSSARPLKLVFLGDGGRQKKLAALLAEAHPPSELQVRSSVGLDTVVSGLVYEPPQSRKTIDRAPPSALIKPNRSVA
jgi:hypothetical protein